VGDGAAVTWSGEWAARNAPMETHAFMFRLKGAHEMSLKEAQLSSKNAVFNEFPFGAAHPQ
jgi:hypothetical protein